MTAAVLPAKGIPCLGFTLNPMVISSSPSTLYARKHCDLSVSPAADSRAVMGCLIILVLVLTYLAKSYGHEVEVHHRTSNCPNQCHAELGWGRCQPHNQEGRHMFGAGSAIRKHFRKMLPHGSCKCKAGHGGKDCSFQMSTIYFSEDVYSGLEVQPLDLQGWGSGLPETVAMYKRLCEVGLRESLPAISVTMPAWKSFLLQEVQPNLIIEIGVWKGQSASHFAGKHHLPLFQLHLPPVKNIISLLDGSYQDG